MDPITRIVDSLVQASHVVAFTGAGCSTDSGIPDFRSPNGVWARNRPVYFDEFLSSATARHEYWRQKSETHVQFRAARPNIVHETLARWEGEGRLKGIITQNIDGLHQRAGSRVVHELHGTALYVSCLSCAARYEADPWVQSFLETKSVPVCPDCQGLLKHATVSFGQSLPEATLESSVTLAEEADVFLALGSSLVVYPAAGLPELSSRAGARLIIINDQPTPLDDLADIVVHDRLASVFEKIESVWGERQSI